MTISDGRNMAMSQSGAYWLWDRGAGEGLADASKYDLVGEAFRSPLGRARVCLHENPNVGAQCMQVCITRASVVPLHRHLNCNESYIVEYGVLGVAVFDNNLTVQSISQFSSGKKNNRVKPIFGVESMTWHLVWSVTDFAIFTEFKGLRSGDSGQQEIHPVQYAKNNSAVGVYDTLTHGVNWAAFIENN